MEILEWIFWPNQYIFWIIESGCRHTLQIRNDFFVFFSIQSHVFHPTFPIYQSPRRGWFGLHESRTPRVRYETSEVMKDSKQYKVKHSHTDNCFTTGTPNRCFCSSRWRSQESCVDEHHESSSCNRGRGWGLFAPHPMELWVYCIFFSVSYFPLDSLFWELTVPHFQAASSGSFGSYL